MKAGLGTAAFGTSISQNDAFEVLDTYVAMGGKIIDTANNYAFWAGHGGESESVIGRWLAGVDRGSVEIHTKIGGLPLDGNDISNPEGLSKTTIESAITASLERLGTDYLDVLYCHIDDLKTPLLETRSALTSYVEKGVVRKLGISNYTLERLEELLVLIEQEKLAPLSFAQYRHSVIKPVTLDYDFGVQLCLTPEIRSLLKEVHPNVTLVAYSPLLDGAFEHGGKLPDAYDTHENERYVTGLRAEADMIMMSPSALVLRHIANDGIIPLCMSGKVKRIKENFALVKKLK
ncbi:General stress protein 69 [Grimontia celer]|uniref:General stress protein 69 n=1 Tax=Grimontia celer TaxID=1796497 RepID=A0A128F9D8_9GAMM|nr:aldo/keto reductase [Grimontia celer]CZF83120.1 General stress protein 69 [Grimontia celer]